MSSRGAAINATRFRLLGGGKRRAISWMLSLGLALALKPGHQALAASVDVWGSVSAAVQYQRLKEAEPKVMGVIEGHWVVETAWDRWQASLTLEPRAVTYLTPDQGGKGAGSVALTEGYVAYQGGAGDLLVGRLTLPIETARLTLPYSLTPPDETGRRRGLEGARADLFLGASRLQVAAVHEGNRWTPMASLGRAFTGWEATGRLVWHERGLAAGLGWSGLIGATVVYGEAWSAPEEPGLRFSVGASGYLGAALWTGELARAPIIPGTAPPAPLIALQWSHAPAPGLNLVVDVSATLSSVNSEHGTTAAESDRAHRWGIAATYELQPGVSEVELSLRRVALPWAPAALSAAAELRYYF